MPVNGDFIRIDIPRSKLSDSKYDKPTRIQPTESSGIKINGNFRFSYSNNTNILHNHILKNDMNSKSLVSMQVQDNLVLKRKRNGTNLNEHDQKEEEKKEEKEEDDFLQIIKKRKEN